MTINFNNTGNSLGGAYLDATQAEWCIGVWIRISSVAGTGHIWQASGGSPANYPALLAQNDHLTLWDPGSSQATISTRRKLLAAGKDQAGVTFGPTAYTNAGGTMTGVATSKQYEKANGLRTLLVVQRRAGVSEIVQCRPGQAAEVVASNTRAWTGFQYARPMTFGVSRVATTDPFDHSFDRPFHISGKALSLDEVTAIANGTAPNSIDQTRAASACIGFLSVVTSGTPATDTPSAWNPTAGTSLTINGVAFTFVASGAVGNQVNIGADVSATIDNLVTVLNASVDPLVSVATYSKYRVEGATSAWRLKIIHDTPGPGGGAFTLAASSANFRLPSAGVLGFVEWEFPTPDAANLLPASYGGGFLNRAPLTAWGTTGADIADTTSKPNAVVVAPYDQSTVYQHTAGVAAIALTGSYLGSAPAGVSVAVLDTAGSTVLSEVALSGFTAGSGTWSGTLSNVPKGKRWLNLRLRKSGGSDYTQTEVIFGVGEVVAISGQSIPASMTALTANVAPNGYWSWFLGSNYTDTGQITNSVYAGDNSWKRPVLQADTPEGLNAIGSIISDQSNCVVGIAVQCIGGTNIATINATGEWNKWTANIGLMRTNRIGWYVWSHGHANSGDATYATALSALLANVKTYMGADTQFGLAIVTNVQASVDQGNGMSFIRSLQRNWLTDKMNPASGNYDPNCFSCGDGHDLSLPGDGVHPSANERSKLAERWALGILYKNGTLARSADGPRILVARRTGAVIKLTFDLNGATALQSFGGDPTGFDVSADNFATLLTITSTVITGANEVTITLASDPGQEVSVVYMYGRPGKYASSDLSGRGTVTQDYTVAQARPLYDNRAGVTFGPQAIPAQPTPAALLTEPPVTASSGISNLTGAQKVARQHFITRR